MENIKTAGSGQPLPVLAARGTVAFPKGVVHLDVARPISIAAIQQAIAGDKRIFVLTQKNINAEQPSKEDMYAVGTVAEIRQFHKYAEDEFRVSAVGLYKAKLIDFVMLDNYAAAMVQRSPERAVLDLADDEQQALMRALKHEFVQYAVALKQLNKEIVTAVEAENDPAQLFAMIGSLAPLSYESKQQMLEEYSLENKIRLLLQTLSHETQIAKMEQQLLEQVEERIDQNQRDYFLREQARLINEELGYDEAGNETEEEYTKKINAIEHIDDSSREKLLGDVKRLFQMPESSHEAYVLTNYLDTVLSLPWDVQTEDNIDIDVAQKQLDADHYGLKKVKERILENLAVRVFNPKVKGQILCLVGPPGVGKTSIGRSIATAIGRNFVRVSLGGINDESDIRGHRKTYIGAMPGRIIAGLVQAKSRNPLILLDEIDKMGASFKGDPSSAMLEVLDGEQNNTFVDHYIEVPFDLSDCLFITTANTLSTIPQPLLDRMEIIELSSYTLEEKFQIGKRYLLPKQLKQHGLTASKVKISDAALYDLIDSYTREAGVRTLERTIASLLRKAAKQIASGKAKSVRYTERNLEKALGPKKYISEKIEAADQVGLVNGLAWTSVGGELMQIEAGVMPGKGVVQLTGNLGDVMKESATAAISYVRSVAHQYDIPADFYQTRDIHIHVPEGAVPKDGPSAGVALATVLVSALTDTPIRRDVAMTGEITLRGRVLPIGGLKEKSIAAYKAGVKTVLIPKENERDLVEIDDVVRESLRFIPCTTADEVLGHALASKRKRKPKPPAPARSTNERQTGDSAGAGLA